MKVLLYDFRWIDENSCEFQAGVNEKFGRKNIWIGDEISIEVCSDVRCAGSVENGQYRSCPKASIGRPKCEYCRVREGNFVVTAFDGFNHEHITDGDLARISGPHVVYLALFGHDLVKIGVARIERKILRQIEQGAHFTLFIAKTPDGIAARQIETLFRSDGIADKSKADQKKDCLCP